MRLTYTSRSGASWDVTQLLQSAAWSGDRQQAARKLEVSLAWSDTDPSYPRSVIGNIDNGEQLTLWGDDGQELFWGFIFTVTKTAGAIERRFVAYDGLVYLLKSSVSQNFTNTTAQGVTRQVCAELGIPVGTLPSDGGVGLSFAHIAKPAYEAILGAWTHVSMATGKKYLPVMTGGKLGVAVVGETVADRTLSPSTDIVGAEITSSIEDAVTRVLVVDAKGKTLSKAEDAEMLRLYGVLQASVQKEDGLDAKTQAKKLLVGADNQITLPDVLGGPDAYDLVTGNAVLVEEPQTGLHGKFFIINDTHSFSEGQHHVALGLSYEAMMDEVEVELIKAAKKKSGTSKVSDSKNTSNSWAAWERYGDVRYNTNSSLTESVN